MYKLLLFLKKTNEEKIINHFNELTLKYLSDVVDEKISAGSIESNLLSDEKYLKFCEATISSKDDWDQRMNTKEGKELNKDLAEFHEFITAIFVNYEVDK